MNFPFLVALWISISTEWNTIFSLQCFTVPYPREEHKPYFILAIIVYSWSSISFQWFFYFCIQSYSTASPKCVGITFTFIDCFQGCYKKGTNKTHGLYGYFAGFYLLIRLITHISKLNDWSYSIVIQSTFS